MNPISIVATIPKPLEEDSPADARSAASFEPGFLVKIHPFELQSGLIRLPQSRFVIGRDAQCDLQLQDASASRFHAVIECGAKGYEITDLKSTNGLYLNGQRVQQSPLKPDDRIRVGDHIFKFLSNGHIEAEYHETVYSMMTRDGLTGVLNKRFFADALTREIDRATRLLRPLSLALFDIDFFKKVNDLYGHLAGDEVLQEFTRRAGRVIPRDAIFARLGGEEFGLLLADCPLAEMVDFCETIRGNIEKSPMSTSKTTLSVTVSIGATCWTNGGLMDSEFVGCADSLLYESKRNGRNRVTSRPFVR